MIENRRVLLLLIALSHGGAEVQVVELAAALRERGWDPLVAGLSPPRGLEKRADALGLPHTHLGLPLGTRSPRLIPRLVRLCRRFRPAVLHTHTLPPNLVGRAARPFCDVPVMITSAHNVYEGGRLKMAAYRLTDRFTDLTTNVSVRAVERYVAIGAVPSRARIRHMPNGMDLQRFAPDEVARRQVRARLGVDDDVFLWLVVGRHDEQKDYPNLLDALQRVRGQRQDFRVVVAGRGPLIGQTRQGISERGLQGWVDLLGERGDVPELMKAADGFVLSSAWEGLPIVLLEAGASALPMVVTDVGGNAEIVHHGVSGFVVPPNDSAALAGAVERLMAMEPEARRRFGASARDTVARRYSMNTVADRWDAVYRELLS